MAARRINLSAAPAAVGNRFVTSVAMGNKTYTLANTTMPTDGGRLVTVTHTAVSTVDTLGVITVTGTDLAGNPITDTITPLSGTTATGTKVFRTVTSVVGSGWVTAAGDDTITVGCAATCYAADRGGVLGAVIVNTTAAGTITLADAAGTIAVLASSIAVGVYRYDLEFGGYLTVTPAAASNITVTFDQFA